MIPIIHTAFGWIFLQQGGQEGGGWSMMVLLGGMVIIFYFFMIRPQMQRQKKEKEFRTSLKKDDQVVTIGGVYGRIHKLYDNEVQLEIAKDTVIKIDRASIRGYAQAAKAEVQSNKKQQKDAAPAKEDAEAEEQTA